MRARNAILIGASLMILLMLNLIPVQSSSEPVFVGVFGGVESYGTGQAVGFLRSLAEIDQSAETYLFWTLEPPRIPFLPYNYSFHAGGIWSQTAEWDHSGNDFYVSGLWTIYNITYRYNIDGSFTKTVELLPSDYLGELNVTADWSVFTVNIEGFDEIAGTVLHYCVRNREPIPVGDVACLRSAPDAEQVPDGEINIYDLAHIAKAYGDTPGIGNYEFSLDLAIPANLDFTIDRSDLTTLATSFGESYHLSVLLHETDRWAEIQETNGDYIAIEPTSDAVWDELVQLHESETERWIGSIVEEYDNTWGFHFKPENVTTGEYVAETYQTSLRLISDDLDYWLGMRAYVWAKVIEIHGDS